MADLPGPSPRLVALVAAALILGGCYTGLDPNAVGATEDLTGGTGGPEPTTSLAQTGTTAIAPDSTGEATTFGLAGTSGETTGPDGTSGQTTGPDATTADDTTGDGTTGLLGTTTTGPGDSDVPAGIDYCVDAAAWDPAWKALEEDVLAQVNQVRAQGANCGSKGTFAPAPPLTMNPALRCAARMHSLDMAARGFFDHTNPDGESPWDRMGKAGYGPYAAAGENIAAGSADAAGTMMQWMTSDGHCANIMSPNFQHLGVGYSPGGQYGHLWTQVFGAK